MNAATVKDRYLEGGDNGEDAWCAPEIVEQEPLDHEVIVDIDDLDGVDAGGNAVNLKPSAAASAQDEIVAPADETRPPQKPSVAVAQAPATAQGDDEYADMEDESLALDESSSIAAVGSASASASAAVDSQATTAAGNTNKLPDDTLLRSRRYDISITYDKYYRTPRVWLFGYDENGSPLKPEAIFSDIMQDYAKKTVTIDPHPHISRPHGKIPKTFVSFSLNCILLTIGWGGSILQY
jgi:ubiquitin-like-conjugating enzyme ATG3